MKRSLKFLVIAVLLSVGFVFFRFSHMGKLSQSTFPQGLASNAVLQVCGEKPNCVVSLPGSPKAEALLAPRYVEEPAPQVFQKLVETLESTEGVKILKKEMIPDGFYIYATDTTRLFGFVDDVEFVITGSSKIDFRSASRVGYSDLGTNKKRIETLLNKSFPAEAKP